MRLLVLKNKNYDSRHLQQMQLGGRLASSDGGLVQVVAHNFDANISSQNGLKSTHGLAMLSTQPKSDRE